MPRKIPHHLPWIAIAGLLALGLGVQLAIAASSPPSPPRNTGATPEVKTGEKSWQDLYQDGLDLAKAEQYAEARKIFEQLEIQQSKNPEVLNMLAYTQRKTGDIDLAIENYNKALKIKPKFPQAREYLGEAYLQAAMREAETLKGYGDAGASDLTKLADAFQEAAAQLENKRSKDANKAVKW